MVLYSYVVGFSCRKLVGLITVCYFNKAEVIILVTADYTAHTAADNTACVSIAQHFAVLIVNVYGEACVFACRPELVGTRNGGDYHKYVV